MKRTFYLILCLQINCFIDKTKLLLKATFFIITFTYLKQIYRSKMAKEYLGAQFHSFQTRDQPAEARDQPAEAPWPFWTCTFTSCINDVQLYVLYTDYRLTDAKVEPFYNEVEKMRNNKQPHNFGTNYDLDLFSISK